MPIPALIQAALVTGAFGLYSSSRQRRAERDREARAAEERKRLERKRDEELAVKRRNEEIVASRELFLGKASRSRSRKKYSTGRGAGRSAARDDLLGGGLASQTNATLALKLGETA